MSHSIPAIAALLALAPCLSAQVDVEPGQRSSLHLELARPGLDEPGLFPDLSAWTADFTLVVSPNTRVAAFAGIGYGRASVPGNPSSATLSNPRLGVVVRALPWLDAELHVDPGLMQELGELHYATTVARLVDFERMERYWPNAWSVGGSLVAWQDLGDGLVAGARLGGTSINSTEGLDRETLLTYAGFMRFPIAATEWSLRISGIALMSEEDLGFSARTVHFAHLLIAAAEVPGRPALFIRAPVDTSIDHLLDWVVGARAQVDW